MFPQRERRIVRAGDGRLRTVWNHRRTRCRDDAEPVAGAEIRADGAGTVRRPVRPHHRYRPRGDDGLWPHVGVAKELLRRRVDGDVPAGGQPAGAAAGGDKLGKIDRIARRYLSRADRLGSRQGPSLADRIADRADHHGRPRDAQFADGRTGHQPRAKGHAPDRYPARILCRTGAIRRIRRRLPRHHPEIAGRIPERDIALCRRRQDAGAFDRSGAQDRRRDVVFPGGDAGRRDRHDGRPPRH